MAEVLLNSTLPTVSAAPIESVPPFPDHTQLPESDGTFVKNFQEHPQALILTDSLASTLARLHPDGNYAIGQDCGIYWRETDPPEKGAEAPDWFYVPHVPPRLAGQIRRSYVVWREFIAPTIALEFASQDGSEERDATPLSAAHNGVPASKPGKFWVYERIIRIPYYGIFLVNSGEFEMYELLAGRYQRMHPNDRGHYAIPPLQVEIGVWQGAYQNQTQPWLRWWDREGNLLLTGQERAEQEHQRAEQERQRAEQERQRAEQECQRADEAEARAARLAERLRELGIDPQVEK